jgi:O-antigen/teichoic acid export membrane protein
MGATANPSYDPDFSGGQSLSSKATRSTVFLFIAKGLRYSFVFIVQLILMNLLTPSDFGLMRFVGVIIGIINLVNEMGLSFAVVQKKTLLDKELSSAFSLNALISSAVYAAIFLLAPLCAAFFGDDRITPLVRVGAFASFFGALSVVHRALLQRRLHYGRLAVIEMASAAAGSGGALVCAVCGLGVWSLLASMIIFNMTSSIALMILHPWPKGNYADLASAKSLSFFGGAVVIQRVLEYCVQNFDYLVVGKAFGEKILGIYSIAHTLIALPQLALGVIVGSVLMSAFSRMQDDDERLVSAFLKVNTLTSIVSVPFFVIIFSYAHEMMHTVSFINRADTWVPAALPIQILSLLGLLFAFSSYPGTIWLSKGRVKLRIGWGVFGLVTVAAAALAGMPFGINGICCALVIRGVVLFPILLMVTHRVIGLKPIRFIKVLVPSVCCGIGMLAVTLVFQKIIPGTAFSRDFLTIIIGSACGMAVYFFLLFFFFKKSFQTLWEMLTTIKEVGVKPL